MKKLICLAASLCLLWAFAAAAEVRFEPVHVSLWTDPETSCEWTCEYDDNGVLSAPMEELIVREGLGADHNFYFDVLKPGRAEIFFNYGANYDVAVPERSVICSVNVDENGGNDVRWAECYSDDRMLMVILPANPTTGWNWSYQEDASGMVRLISEEYVPMDDALEGAGGSVTYQLWVEKPGTAVLMFNYSNLWDPAAAAAETYSLIVTANADMEISMTVDQQ